MREAFVKTLIKEAEKNKKIILLTADLGFMVFEGFREKFPDRFINVGDAEQNMMGVAAGLALSGKIVFAYSIVNFATLRCFEQIRNNIAAQNASVIIVGVGGGLCYSHDGLTHHGREDICLMRSLPQMTILSPADPVEAIWLTKQAIKLKKPVYLRLGKRGESVLSKKMPELKLEKGRILRKGKDIALIATGNIVFNALKAAEILSQKKIQATVVSMHTLKPIDVSLIKKFARKFSLLVTIEEHSLIGGLGSAVAEVLVQEKSRARQLSLGLPDKFIMEVGSHQFLRERFGLSPKGIASQIINVFRRQK